jgi:hypothetical protein
MSKFTHEGQARFVQTFSLIISVVSIIGVLALGALEAYVRWNINQEFTFLGEATLPALAIASFGLLAAILFTTRKD